MRRLAGEVQELASAGWANRQDPVAEAAFRSEERPLLHEEVSRLPQKYRTPIVLCYFEGLTHDEAAARLGWPIGTVKGRLSRARDLLRSRLTRRGVAVPAAALAVQFGSSELKAAVPASLTRSTLTAAVAVATEASARAHCLLGRFAFRCLSHRRSHERHGSLSHQVRRTSCYRRCRSSDQRRRSSCVSGVPWKAGPSISTSTTSSSTSGRQDCGATPSSLASGEARSGSPDRQ